MLFPNVHSGKIYRHIIVFIIYSTTFLSLGVFSANSSDNLYINQIAAIGKITVSCLNINAIDSTKNFFNRDSPDDAHNAKVISSLMDSDIKIERIKLYVKRGNEFYVYTGEDRSNNSLSFDKPVSNTPIEIKKIFSSPNTGSYISVNSADEKYTHYEPIIYNRNLVGVVESGYNTEKIKQIVTGRFITIIFLGVVSIIIYFLTSLLAKKQ